MPWYTKDSSSRFHRRIFEADDLPSARDFVARAEGYDDYADAQRQGQSFERVLCESTDFELIQHRLSDLDAMELCAVIDYGMVRGSGTIDHLRWLATAPMPEIRAWVDQVLQEPTITDIMFVLDEPRIWRCVPNHPRIDVKRSIERLLECATNHLLSLHPEAAVIVTLEPNTRRGLSFSSIGFLKSRHSEEMSRGIWTLVDSGTWIVT